jgi:hypothetical protein
VRSSKITKTAKATKTSKIAKTDKIAKSAQSKSKSQTKSKTKKKSVSDRVSFLERKLKKVNSVVVALEGKVAKLQSWRQDLIDDSTSKFDTVGTRLEEYKEQIDEFLAIARQQLARNGSARTGYKSGLGTLVERGGANPVDGNAARIGGGVVYTKE